MLVNLIFVISGIVFKSLLQTLIQLLTSQLFALAANVCNEAVEVVTENYSTSNRYRPSLESLVNNFVRLLIDCLLHHVFEKWIDIVLILVDLEMEFRL